jgi:hypothetical protein
MGRIRALRRRQPVSFSRHDISLRNDRDQGGPRLFARHGDALARRSRRTSLFPLKQGKDTVVHKKHWCSWARCFRNCCLREARDGDHYPHRVVGLIVNLLEHRIDIGCTSLFASERQLDEVSYIRNRDRSIDRSAVSNVRSAIRDFEEIHEIVEPVLKLVAGSLRT